MDRTELILALCREAGEDEDEATLCEGWEGNHSGCCVDRLDCASQGDPGALLQIRVCMGLPLTT